MGEFPGDWFSFEGRIGRQTYWLRGLALAVPNFIGYMIVSQESAIAILLGLALVIVASWAGLATSVKRAHDRDKSGYFVLVSLIPFIGSIWLLIELGFRVGTPGPNSYGPAPGTVVPAYA